MWIAWKMDLTCITDEGIWGSQKRGRAVSLCPLFVKKLLFPVRQVQKLPQLILDHCLCCSIIESLIPSQDWKLQRLWRVHRLGCVMQGPFTRLGQLFFG